MGAECAQDVPDVVANRLLAQVEHLRDLLGRRALTEQLQNLILTCREPRSAGRRLPRFPRQDDSEDSVAVIAVLDRHRADLGPPAAPVGGDYIHLVVGERRALELPLELLANDGDVFGHYDRGERPASEIAEHSLGRVVGPRDRSVTRCDEAGIFTLLSVLVSSIEERFCGI